MLVGLPVIAEDLGVITEDVVALIEQFGFGRMKVLQFAFQANERNDYLPYKYDRNAVVYTGTHDNDTVVGWLSSRRGGRSSLRARLPRQRRNRTRVGLHSGRARLARRSSPLSRSRISLNSEANRG